MVDENETRIDDGILTIVADVEWDEAGMPTKWDAKEIFVNCEYNEPITLKDIREMYPKSRSIKVIMDSALRGRAYHYQYQGDGSYWTNYGTTNGYA